MNTQISFHLAEVIGFMRMGEHDSAFRYLREMQRLIDAPPEPLNLYEIANFVEKDQPHTAKWLRRLSGPVVIGERK